MPKLSGFIVIRRQKARPVQARALPTLQMRKQAQNRRQLSWRFLSPPEGFQPSRLPRAALPPGALVVAFSPLLDGRFVEALRDMRERGFALIVVDVLNIEPPVRRRFADTAARRIWLMEQQAIRFSLRELGVPVVPWDGATPLDLPLAPYTRRPLVTRR